MFAIPEIAKYLERSGGKVTSLSIILGFPGVTLAGPVLMHGTADHSPAFACNGLAVASHLPTDVILCVASTVLHWVQITWPLLMCVTVCRWNRILQV